MTVAAGVITMTGTAAAGGKTFILTPALNAAGSAIVWTQSGDCKAANYCK
jgi:type IV pilus assembly protein PilA